ncbi:putative carotenoid cleavage dioxygenase 8-like protein B, chloroplastic isoform X1 [Iris pallida]|uniref:Carotenoid cleavage dioxygenase 8-like protein B, chloroplastic isoform X1 n=1 Tax=Iris pallida TaxID=29817 RepID=A0AAX6G6K7_IRIPA|nr:putative carotenoid cleavage dioxygenase 8-like protein B, chloroplastic isoform X1 [Iris pallida]
MATTTFMSATFSQASRLPTPVRSDSAVTPGDGSIPLKYYSDRGTSRRRDLESLRARIVADKIVAVPSRTGEGKLGAWTSIRQEQWEGELKVEGEIPIWLKGTYLRNGPGLWHIDDYDFRHLFDGYATVARLSFDQGRLVFGHRQVESEAYKAARSNRRLCYREFSEVPKPDSFLSYVGELASLFSGSSLTDNANTGVVRLGDGRVVCLTETIKGSIEIDPDTLDTIGRFEYSDSLGGLIHSAHPVVTDTEFLTLLPDLVRPGYTVVRMGAGTNERKVIGRVDCRGGAGAGVGALVPGDGALRRRAGDVVEVLRAEPAEGGADAAVQVRVAPGVRELRACHVQSQRQDCGKRRGPQLRNLPLHQRIRRDRRRR